MMKKFKKNFVAQLFIEQGRKNSFLREVSIPVEKINSRIKKFIQKMKKTVKKEDGCGLAAPQVGENFRVILALLGKKMTILINPEMEILSEEKNIDEEGCLSVPGEFGKVWRYTDISVNFLDEKGLKKKLLLKKFDARVIQHEIDHLNGILFVDRMTPEHIEEMNIATEKERKKKKI